MTAPRRIEPGATYFLTRRCAQQEFLLQPDENVEAIFAYCLAEAAHRFNVQLIAWLVMSNHYHAVVHDTDGRVPAFLEHFHKMTAKAINALRKRRENMWSSEETCVTLLATEDDILDKVIYVLTNPVAAKLVDRVTDWPGFHSMRHLDGRATTHARPTLYFKSNSKVMPESVTLRAVKPPGLTRSRAATWNSEVRAGVAKRERLLRAKRAEKAMDVRGREVVLATKWTTKPSQTKRLKAKLRPALACRDKDRRIQELARLKGFRAEYRATLKRYMECKTAAARDKIIFPAGTYRLRALGVRCAPFR